MVKIIEVDGHALEYEVSGEGSPCIVLLSGERVPMQFWDKARALMDGIGTVLTYNRPGVGKSSKPTSQQSADVVSSTLHQLLEKLDLEPPFLLVGHSSGGLLANLYARLHPAHICGVVLVESSHPEQVARLEGHLSLIPRFFQWLGNRNPNRDFHPSEENGQFINESGPFPELPLIVISGAKKMWITSNSAHSIHLENQKELAQLTQHGEHIVAEHSGHLVPFTEPEIVSDAVESLAKKTRGLPDS